MHVSPTLKCYDIVSRQSQVTGQLNTLTSETGITMHTNLHLRKLWQPFVLLALIVLGITLSVTGTIDPANLVQWARQHIQHWWVALALIVLQVFLYTFALPGSLVLWIVAPVYQPIMGSTILVIGSTLGALTAYLFAQQETTSWSLRVKGSHLYAVLKKRGDFLTLCAMRIMPTFPHSVINYGSGILRLPLVPFLISSVIGFSLKSSLYCNAIYGAVSASEPAELIRITIIGPLVIVTLLVVLGEYVRVRWLRTHQ
jgi:uncharacterized membrane protein YdjX (TVP38/TMEM64 family)